MSAEHPAPPPLIEPTRTDYIPAGDELERLHGLREEVWQIGDMQGLARRLVETAQHNYHRDFWLIWWSGDRSKLARYPLGTIDAEEVAFVNQCTEHPSELILDRHGVLVGLSLCDARAPFGAVLLCAGGMRPVSERNSAHFMRYVRGPVNRILERDHFREEVIRLERAEKIQKAQFAIADMAGSGLEMSEMLRGMHAIVRQLMYAESFYIATHDATADTVSFIYFQDTNDPSGPGTAPIPMSALERGRTWYLIRDKKALIGTPAEVAAQASGPLADFGATSIDYLGVPMLSDSQIRGAMVVQSYLERERYSMEDLAVLSFVAQQILTAIDRRQAHSELERRVVERTRELTVEIQERQHSERLQATLFQIAELSNTALNLEAFYHEVHNIVGAIIDCRNFYIALVSEDWRELEFAYYVDQNDDSPGRRPLGRGITEFVLGSGKPLLVNTSSPEGMEAISALHRSGEVVLEGQLSVCWLGVPLQWRDRVVGVLAVQSYTEGVVFTQRDLDLLTFISFQIAIGLERQRAAAALQTAYADLEQRVLDRTKELSEQIAVRETIEQRLKYQVVHDALTGLPNRAYLRDALARVLARQARDGTRPFAVLFMDLDRFKVINDSAGHLVGDLLLKEVARRFTQCVRSPDIVARLGGDEFAILLDEISGGDSALRVARRVVESLVDPVMIDGREFFTSVSVGIAVSNPRYVEADELLRDADIAMYRAKASDEQHIEMFDEKLHAQALRQLELEGELRQALIRQEFEPYFQPIVDLNDGRVIGYEALLRWQRPADAVRLPGEFLQVAEASGTLEAVDWQMFRRTCELIPELLESGQYVNLNFSPRHFRSRDLDVRFLDLLASYGIEPSQVRIEITEGALVHNAEQVSLMLNRLFEAGVMVALDDFGTGYSSLSYLHQFRLHTLKIDRSFVNGLRGEDKGKSMALIRAILALSRSQGLEVVAEGIEDIGQRQVLLDLGCTMGQGYFFGHPHPLDIWQQVRRENAAASSQGGA
jgi:diguanylate cyclase (GGDEF)-like protein